MLFTKSITDQFWRINCKFLILFVSRFFNLCPHIIACMHAHAIRNICRKATSPSPNINIASAPIVAFVIIVLSAIGPHNPKANALESNKIQGDRGRMMVWAQFGKLPGHTTASQVYWPIKQMCSAVKLWKISKGGNFNNHHRILLGKNVLFHFTYWLPRSKTQTNFV